jgi:hypothetical protein
MKFILFFATKHPNSKLKFDHNIVKVYLIAMSLQSHSSLLIQENTTICCESFCKSLKYQRFGTIMMNGVAIN